MKPYIKPVLTVCAFVSLLLVVGEPAAAQNTWPLQNETYLCNHVFPDGGSGECDVVIKDLNGSQYLRRGTATTKCYGEKGRSGGNITWDSGPQRITVTKPVACGHYCTRYEYTVNDAGIQCKNTMVATVHGWPMGGSLHLLNFDACYPNGVKQWCRIRHTNRAWMAPEPESEE